MALVTLIAGASLGPEAPLADACGGIGTWAADRLKLDEKETCTASYGGLSGMLAAFITNPFVLPARLSGWQNLAWPVNRRYTR